MTFDVDHIDPSGTRKTRRLSMSGIAFAKYFAIAGQGYMPRPQKLLRALGMFLHYAYYLRAADFNANRFSQPPPLLSDPTEKGQFSNLAAKAIADFLSKRIDGSILTVGYEAVMRSKKMKIGRVNRPDLIAFTPGPSMLAIETKCRTSSSSGNMTKHKAQSQTGPIPVNYSVASIAYNMYEKLKCNYHDPYADNVPFDKRSLATISKRYYGGLAEFINNKYFEYREITLGNERFYEIDLLNRSLRKELIPFFPHPQFWVLEAFGIFGIRLILPINIDALATTGIILSKETNYIPFEGIQEGSLYIDNDRVGLRVLH